MVAPLVVRGLSAAALAAKAALKAKRAKAKAQRAKDAAKKAAPKKTSFKSQEARLRKENKGDERTKGRIKRLKEQNESGLISDGERARKLQSLTKENRSRSVRRNPGE